MALGERLQAKFPQHVLSREILCGDEVVFVARDGIRAVAQYLRDEPEMDFNFLMDLTCVDYLDQKKTPRFEMVYMLYSLTHNHRIRLRVPVDESDLTVDTLTPVWHAADWFEREVWDMFGVRFPGHPNPKRLLMYEEFEGHPLRKDYPVTRRQPLIGPKN